MNKLIVANIKMNKDSLEMNEYLKILNKVQKENEVAVLAPTPFLFLSKLYTNLSYGVQNFFYQPCGAYTGEVNLDMLEQFDIKYALIGHSERRKNFKESNSLINKKILKALENGVTPILCIGESLGQTKSANLTKAYLKRQLTLALRNVRVSQLESIIIAYEPTYAIGAENPADIIAVESNIALIRELISARTKNPVSIRVLYGGSLNVENYKTFLNSESIDGLLVGRASLDIENFKEMVK